MTLALPPKDTAKALGISERHLSRLTAQGIIPSVMLGRNRRYLPPDIEAALAA